MLVGESLKGMQEAVKQNLQKATSAKRESKRIEFIDRFDPKQAKDWCEIVKEMVSMTNSGGGIIVVGVRNDGSPATGNASAFLELDPAHITDKISKYTGEQFDQFAIKEFDKEGHKIAILLIDGVSIPLIFTNPGTYEVTPQKQDNAFAKGTIYFRHGAKSEPGNTNDLRKAIEKELEHIRKSWLKNIRKVVYAPTGHQLKIFPPQVTESNLPIAQPVRIVDDPNAPAYRQVWDESPYQSPQEIVVGVLKSWRHDKSSYASESDMWTLYSERESLQLDEEKAECLLESAINRLMPFFFFAQFLSGNQLLAFIKRSAPCSKYPAPQMLMKLAYIIGGELGSTLVDYIADNCKYFGIKSRTPKLKETISRPDRIDILYGNYLKLGGEVFHPNKLGISELEALMTKALETKDKMVTKHLDARLYAPRLKVKEKLQ